MWSTLHGRPKHKTTSCSWAISHCTCPDKDLAVPGVAGGPPIPLRCQIPQDPSWTPPLGQVTASAAAGAKSRGWLVSQLLALWSLSLVKALCQDPWTYWRTGFLPKLHVSQLSPSVPLDWNWSTGSAIIWWKALKKRSKEKHLRHTGLIFLGNRTKYPLLPISKLKPKDATWDSAKEFV